MSAKLVIDFIHNECCQKNGQPITLMPWQLDVIRRVYDTVDDKGLRIVRQLLCFLPRRNGKSTFFACLLMYHLVTDPPASEIYILSNTITQSNDSIFDACLSIVTNSPRLRKRLKVVKSRGRIVNKKNRSRLAVLSSTQQGLMGKDASILCFDEVAFFKDRRLVANLKGSQLNRPEPLALYCTTASDNLDGVGKEIYDYGVKVRDGVIDDPSFASFIFEAKPDEDWRSAETWARCNPSLGTLLQADDLRKLADEAAAEPRKQSEFLQFHLNRWQHSSICWLTKELWDSCGADFTEDFLLGKTCFGGLDLARRHDLAVYSLVFPIEGDYYILPRFFLPKEGIEAKAISDHAPLVQWADQGYITLTEGDVIDYQKIREAIKADAIKFRIEELGYDPWSAELLANQQLRQEDGINAVEVRQRIDIIAPACMQFEKLLKERHIKHNRNPVLNWHAANVKIRSDSNGNITTDKKHSRSRFDGIQATIIGLSRCITDPQGPCFFTFDS